MTITWDTLEEQHLDLLEGDELMVLIFRTNFNSTGKPENLQTVADLLGLTREQVRQTELKALRRINELSS